MSSSSQLSLVPLGPGDLIDRAVRFYRRNFWTFFFIAAPPVITGTVISVGWTFLARSLFSISESANAINLSLYYMFVWLGSLVIWFTETVATLSVMGGASRNFVRHLLFNEPITFRETYANTWNRLGALLVASSMIAIVLGTVGMVIFYIGFIVGALVIFLVVATLAMIPPLAILVGAVLSIAVTIGTV